MTDQQEIDMTTGAANTDKADLARQTNPGLDQLPCMVAGKWSPPRSGMYKADCDTGRQAAAELIEIIDRTDNPVFFGTVIRAIVANGTFEGVEIGFCSGIGINLINRPSEK